MTNYAPDPANRVPWALGPGEEPRPAPALIVRSAAREPWLVPGPGALQSRVGLVIYSGPVLLGRDGRWERVA